MFISSVPSGTVSPTLGPLESLGSLRADKLSSGLMRGSAEFHTGSRPGTANSISTGMTRSASSPGTPAPPPEASAELPAYLIAKPSTLPPVFVRDSPEYLRSQAEIAATLGSSEMTKRSSRIGSVTSTSSTSPSSIKRGTWQSQLVQPPGSPYGQATSPTPTASKDALDTAENGSKKSGIAPSGSSHRESFASSLIPPSSSNGGVLAPSRAKSTPEFASRVRFKLDDENPPVLPATFRVRGTSGSGTISSSKGPPPSSYLPSAGRRNGQRKSGSNGPPVLPPLDIPSTSSFASAAEDIISSASASVIFQAEEEKGKRQRQMSLTGASTSSRTSEMPPLLDHPAKRSSKRKLRNMDSAAMIEHAIAKNQRKKNPQYVVRTAMSRSS